MRPVCTFVAILIAFTAISDELNAATLCDQDYKVLTKTPGAKCILIYRVDIGGECQGGYTHFLFIAGDETQHCEQYEGYRSESWFLKIFETFPTEVPDSAEIEDSVIHLTEIIDIVPPPFDSATADKFDGTPQDIGGDLKYWYEHCGQDCVDQPLFTEVPAKLIYYDKGGLYKNYKISQVLHYRESGYVVVSTHQPMKAVGLDSMHGLMIFHLGR